MGSYIFVSETQNETKFCFLRHLRVSGQNRLRVYVCSVFVTESSLVLNKSCPMFERMEKIICSSLPVRISVTTAIGNIYRHLTISGLILFVNYFTRHYELGAISPHRQRLKSPHLVAKKWRSQDLKHAAACCVSETVFCGY